MHLVEHGLNRKGAESGCQNAMRLAPIGFIVKGLIQLVDFLFLLLFLVPIPLSCYLIHLSVFLAIALAQPLSTYRKESIMYAFPNHLLKSTLVKHHSKPDKSSESHPQRRLHRFMKTLLIADFIHQPL